MGDPLRNVNTQLDRFSQAQEDWREMLIKGWLLAKSDMQNYLADAKKNVSYKTYATKQAIQNNPVKSALVIAAIGSAITYYVLNKRR